MKHRLTIGIPVFNGAQFITEALDSILAQTFDNFAVVISDNASTDETESICKAYAERDHRIRYFREAINRGAAWNYNRVFELAKTPYFKWAAHDDICAPTFFERCIETLDQNPQAALVYPRTTIIDKDSQFVRHYLDELDFFDYSLCKRYRSYMRLYRKPRSCNPVFGLMRRDILAQTPLIGSFVASDMILLAELILRGHIIEIPEYLFLRRDHDNVSIRAYPSYRDRIAWFDPNKKGRLQLSRWRWLYEYHQSLQHVSMSALERLCCHAYLAEWAAWNTPGLVKDTIRAILWPLLKNRL
ncbi:MAG: glycosyltransferase family 2 protein [Anaerolineales bacterium]|nr:glycosyltransferase family 2 protein [Anaerolineales bacterium]